ncbi:MAG: c-type cytochrome [Terriglobales bacterium]
MMKGFLLGIIVTVVVIAAVVYIYFAGGYAPVGTAAQAMPFEKTFARMALDARVRKEAPHQVPMQADESNLAAGANIYVEHCAVCHGLPGKEQSAIAQGEFPQPPHLFKGKGVTDDEPGETYWKVANGIRMTGMPAFEKHLSPTELWQVSLLLANADKLPAPVMAILNNATEPTGHPAGQSHEGAPHTH